MGIILYEMAAGRHPWPRASAVDTMHAILHDDPPAMHGPAAAIEHIVRRCLAKQPELRFQTMAELGTALQSPAASSGTDLPRKQSSIAVLPFANMSADKENEYFGDGLAEEIINVLAHVPGMKVAGRTSSFFFRGKDVEVGEIGRRLNVEHILEGSIRKAGSRLRVSAQLIKVTDGFHLWSERYDRELTDLFAIQDEITQSIAGALRIKLSPEDAAPRRHVPNLRAYEAFLKGREHLLLRPSPESITLGKELLEHAIKLDPAFALPYSILGYLLHRAGSRPACSRASPVGACRTTRGATCRPFLARSPCHVGSVCRYGVSLERGGRALGFGDGSWNPYLATFSFGTGTTTCCRVAARWRPLE